MFLTRSSTNSFRYLLPLLDAGAAIHFGVSEVPALQWLSSTASSFGACQLQAVPKVSLLALRPRDLPGNEAGFLPVLVQYEREACRSFGTFSTEARQRVIALTQDITGCKGWEEVAGLIRSRGDEFDHIHLGAAMTTLARIYKVLAGNDRQLFHADGIMLELERIAASKADNLNAQAVSNVLYSFAKLEHQLDPHLLLRLVSVVSSRLPKYNAQEIANTFWALAKLQHQPEPALMQRMMGAVISLLPEFGPQNLSNTMWALATMRQDPGRELLQCFSEAISTLLPEFTAQGLSNTMWACAVMGYNPGSECLHRMASRAIEFLPSMISQEISNIVWALGKLQPMHVPHFLLNECCNVLVRQAAGFTEQGLCNIMLGFAYLSYRPSEAVVDIVVHEVVLRADILLSQAWGNLTWAFGRLGIVPAQEFFEALSYAILHHGLEGFNGQSISTILWAVAELRVQLPQEVLDALAKRFLTLLPTFNEQDLSLTIWALAMLKCRLSEMDLRAFAQAAGRLIPEFTAHGFGMTFWGLDELGVKPDLSVLDIAERMIRTGQTPKGDKLDAQDYHYLAKVLNKYAKRSS